MLSDLIKEYYDGRKLKYPDAWEAMAFSITEIGEVYELLLDKKGGWVRNNPQNKPTFSKESLAEELGDVIMMVMVAGIVEGADPIDALEKKIHRKLSKLRETTIMTSLGFDEAKASVALDKDKSMSTQYKEE